MQDPLTKRFLFAFDPEEQTVSITHRGVQTEVNLRRLTQDPEDRDAIVSRPVPRT